MATPNNFRVKSGLNVGTTIAGGNTTITGFANVSTSVNSALLTVGSSFIANSSGITSTGFANVATTLAAGNTTITGFANVSSTLNVTGNVKTGAVVTVNTVASAWANTAKAVQIGSASVWNNQDETNVYISQNYFFNGTTYKYIQDGVAAGYSMQGGDHSWYKAPTGIANANVTLTSIMALYALVFISFISCCV